MIQIFCEWLINLVPNPAKMLSKYVYVESELSRPRSLIISRVVFVVAAHNSHNKIPVVSTQISTQSAWKYAEKIAQLIRKTLENG